MHLSFWNKQIMIVDVDTNPTIPQTSKSDDLDKSYGVLKIFNGCSILWCFGIYVCLYVCMSVDSSDLFQTFRDYSTQKTKQLLFWNFLIWPPCWPGPASWRPFLATLATPTAPKPLDIPRTYTYRWKGINKGFQTAYQKISNYQGGWPFLAKNWKTSNWPATFGRFAKKWAQDFGFIFSGILAPSLT